MNWTERRAFDAIATRTVNANVRERLAGHWPGIRKCPTRTTEVWPWPKAPRVPTLLSELVALSEGYSDRFRVHPECELSSATNAACNSNSKFTYLVSC